ncbi:uncharacterized protein LOC118414447 [Branchiostoma floridae]|uniref:Uncharacterized protein LOC118414447 n=1 Tax=Branchiostoma floridae TaxID=7739 RepID=A0A9J7L1D4_BRAFL|nr:uncharacterized protein LOC118414447 [Branchiostoma floridae]
MRLFLVTVAALSVGQFAVTHQATTVSAPADYYKVILYYSYKVIYFSLFILSTLAGCISVQARGPREYRPRSADVLLLVIGALGVLVLNVRSLDGWTKTPRDPESFPFKPEGCPHGITDGDFPKLRALLMADAVLNLTQLVLQTTFILSSVIHRRLEGRVGAHSAILCLFNISVWINGSFVEVCLFICLFVCLFINVTHCRLEGRVGAHCAILCLFNISVWINGSFVEVCLFICLFVCLLTSPIAGWREGRGSLRDPLSLQPLRLDQRQLRGGAVLALDDLLHYARPARGVRVRSGRVERVPAPAAARLHVLLALVRPAPAQAASAGGEPRAEPRTGPRGYRGPGRTDCQHRYSHELPPRHVPRSVPRAVPRLS